MKKYNPVNLAMKATTGLDLIINKLDRKSTYYSVLLVSENWFDEDVKALKHLYDSTEGDEMDMADKAKNEYLQCFEKISTEISQLINEKPITISWEENEKVMLALIEENELIFIAKYWHEKHFMLFVEQEDKELPISITLIKKELKFNNHI